MTSKKRIPARTRATAGPGRRVGLTLLELVLVMFILSVVLGSGLGFFATLDTGRRQAAGLVKNVLRTAQNTAIASQAPARVRLDLKAGRLAAEVMQVVGTWHFEKRRLQGGNQLDGEVDEALFTDDGYMGSCLYFEAARGRVASIPVEDDPAFDLAYGFAVDCALRFEGGGGGRVLTIGSAFSLEVGGAGEVRGRFTSVSEKQGFRSAGAQVSVQSEPGTLVPGSWHVVRLHYDRRDFVLVVDGIPLANTLETSEVWEIDGPLILSDPQRPFLGSIDNLVVSVVVTEEGVTLADTVRFGADSPELIHFAPGGGLDRVVHADPVRVHLDFDDGTRETINVGFFGTVE